MTVLHRNALVSYSAAEMYQLVNAIEDYPQFLPWCKESTILSRNDDEIHATLVLARGGMQKAFTTCNRLQKDKMIEIRLVNGPMQQLEGFWRFESLDNTRSRVTLDLEFEFSNKFLGMAFGPIFHQATNTLVEAFCSRAQAVYGQR